MAAIISEKFRIFNAKQFLESLGEAAPTNMYFFVGRPTSWYSYVEISNPTGTWDTTNTIDGGPLAGASVVAIYDNSLLLSTTASTAAPTAGSTLTQAVSGATAKIRSFRYATEDAPPAPLDNQTEKARVYDDIIAAKRIISDQARHVAPRYNWSLTTNPKFDMYRPDYSATPAGGGALGVQTALGSSSLSGSKYYVMNSNYEVFKCIYNGTSPASPTGTNVQFEPKKTPSAGEGAYSNGIYSEGVANGYVWKYMYTLSTGEVIAFLSSDFMPIGTYDGPAAVSGAVHVALDGGNSAALPATSTFYVPIDGDGTGGIVKIVTTAGGAVSTVEIEDAGSGYTYANVRVVDGNAFQDSALSAAVGSWPAAATAHIVAILSPEGGHGADLPSEFYAKRVMTNIRLTYAEGSGDFPVDNDFRRIGIIQDPVDWGTSTKSTATTLRGTFALKITNPSADYVPDEVITQAGTNAKGTVVSYDSTNKIVKYFQSPELHTHEGKVVAFSGTGNVTGATSTATGAVDDAQDTALADIAFTDGIATPEIKPDSGDIVYIENRRLITRAPDQIEDIKLVIEF